jgi:hypothetical protein
VLSARRHTATKYLSLGSGIAVSLGVGVLGWLLSPVFNVSTHVALKTFS